jgi:transcriptional regulator with XRE-family HTH domain
MTDSKKAPLPSALRAEMSRAGVTTGALAAFLSVTRQTVSAWRSGDTDPPARALVRIEAHLGLRVGVLYGELARGELAPDQSADAFVRAAYEPGRRISDLPEEALRRIEDILDDADRKHQQ